MSFKPCVAGLLIAGNLMVLSGIAVAQDTSGASIQKHIKVGDLTTGACVTVCESISFCSAMDYDAPSGECTLFVKDGHPDYVAFVESCPTAAFTRGTADLKDDKWQVTCIAK